MKNKSTLREINARLAVEAAPSKKSKGTIETDTPIMPGVVADRVVGLWIDGIESLYPDVAQQAQRKTDQLADYLADEANRLYGVNARFRKNIQASGNKGRDLLTSFMFHWMTARMLKSFPVVKLRSLPKNITGVSTDL